MTPLKKPVRRELISSDRKGRPLILSVEPGDVLTFRPKGMRKTVMIHAGHCFMLAQIMDAEQQFRKAQDDYKTGKRKRRPKKPSLPFGKVYFQALKG